MERGVRKGRDRQDRRDGMRWDRQEITGRDGWTGQDVKGRYWTGRDGTDRWDGTGRDERDGRPQQDGVGRNGADRT